MGAAIVLWRSGMVNVATRVALYIGLLEQSVLDQPAPVFDSLEEFVKHHSRKDVFSRSIDANTHFEEG